MSERKRITHQFMQVVGSDPLIRLIVPALLLIGVFYAAAQVLQGDWIEFLLAVGGVLMLITLAAVAPVQRLILGQPFNRRHALYIGLTWIYGAIWLALLRLLLVSPLFGKASEQTYFTLILLIAVSWMLLRSLLVLTRTFYHRFVTAIPLWEQLLVAANEGIAAGLLATIGASALVHVFQPNIFTTRFDVAYLGGIGVGVALYYLTMQFMWTQRWNDWLSRSDVWIMLARLFAPLALIVTTLVIFRHFIDRADPRSANLLGGADFDLAVLALAPVIWLLILVGVIIVYTGGRGIRQRFLPDLLLDRLPRRIGDFLRSISDMDMLLILGGLATFIPAYLLLFGNTGGVIGQLRQQILQRGSALIETSEQALALLFTMPFYVLIVALLALYGYALSQQTLSAQHRDELVNKLPIGFLIVLIITLYFFALPFSQVLTEGRLPQLPQDLGRILAFNVLFPLILLYAHYFVLIRQPYARGQNRWRGQQNRHYDDHLSMIDRQIAELNAEIEQLDRQWQSTVSPGDPARFETLYRYIQLNGLRDNLNMQRLQVVANRQELADLSDAPVSIAVARLPVRIVSIGIPLLLAMQIYQWAILNNGLREIINNPNITIFEFFRAILKQTQF
jgi:hypothetical protein